MEFAEIGLLYFMMITYWLLDSVGKAAIVLDESEDEGTSKALNLFQTKPTISSVQVQGNQ